MTTQHYLPMHTSILVVDILYKFRVHTYRQMQTSDLMIYDVVIPVHLDLKIDIILQFTFILISFIFVGTFFF